MSKQATSLATLREGDGSNFEITKRGEGVLHVTTTGQVQFVRDFKPVMLDVLVHFREDGTTSIARAHVAYRYGNPGSIQVEEPLRTEILQTILNLVHVWRTYNWLAATVGVIAKVEDIEKKIEEARDLTGVLEANLTAYTAELNRAQVKVDETREEYQATRAKLNALTKQVVPEYILTTSEKDFPEPSLNWYVYTHYMGGDMVAVEAIHQRTADEFMGKYLGWELESMDNVAPDDGDVWSFRMGGSNEDGSYPNPPAEGDVLNMGPRPSGAPRAKYFDAAAVSAKILG